MIPNRLVCDNGQIDSSLQSIHQDYCPSEKSLEKVKRDRDNKCHFGEVESINWTLMIKTIDCTYDKTVRSKLSIVER